MTCKEFEECKECKECEECKECKEHKKYEECEECKISQLLEVEFKKKNSLKRQFSHSSASYVEMCN